ncbi:hypothetical protein ACH5RR_013103 [Cinchona calisaya]|uniref:DUF4220 domain-containing protein n=1 Tax=Cinchona calisaya TaxID=153742 RepID=A0ABD2ZZ46_9GENT
MFLSAASALVYVQKRSLWVVFPDNVKQAWKKWEVRLLILISLIFQVVLILLGHRRKYMAKRTSTRLLIWSAYLLADWVATVALGVISQDTLDDCKVKGSTTADNLMDELVSFWAPFLLLHLGGPDTITAYALEDNELWLRHLVGLIIQTSLAFYIFLVALPGSSWFPILNALIFCAGLVKYVERTLALRSANIDHLRDSMLTPPDSGPNYAKFMEEFTLKKAEGFYVEADEVKEIPIQIEPSYPKDEKKLIAEAHDRFQTFKRLFVDLILSFQDRESSQSYFKKLYPQQAFDVVEVELGFAFDMFYTKVPIVYTVRGCILRLITFSCTSLALILFVILCEKHKYHKVDVILTYFLLVVAILLEIYAVKIQIHSDWTDYWLQKNNIRRESLIGASDYRRPSKRRWSNSMAQYNLLSFCLEEKPVVCYKAQKLLHIDEFREKHRYKTYENVSLDLKVMIFDRFKKFAETSEPGPPSLSTRRGSFALEWTNKAEIEFDRSILIWHITTDICYYSDRAENSPDVSSNCRESKHLSDYMLHLLVLHPFMLPIGIGLIRFRDTCAEAREFFKDRRLESDKAKACMKLLQVNTEVSPAKVKGDRSKSVLFDACRLAKKLQSKEKDRKWDIISEVWVEMLAYAATHCRGRNHAQQLRKGGELLTHVWLLMAHLGITEQFQINQGHARAKLIVK